MAESTLFAPNFDLSLFPLDVVKVVDPFDSDAFFIVTADSLTQDRLPHGVNPALIDSRSLPPIKDWQHRKQYPKAWLGIRAPFEQNAHRIKNAVLGALALAPNYRNRHLFSGRRLTTGWCKIGQSLTYSSSSPPTPPLMNDVYIDTTDHEWMCALSLKLKNASKTTIREIRALEYYYRAWFLDDSERFPVLYMGLDALFGDANRATQAVVDAIRELIGAHVEERRIRALSDLRAAIIHGGAPQVYDSSKYIKYYRKYHEDPVRDLGILTAECLRKRIFGGALVEKNDPEADVIRTAIESGRISPPKNASIVNPAD